MKSLLSEIISKPSAPVDNALAGFVDQLLTWQQRARDRQALSQLDEHMRHDIGLSAADVEHESSKPFWRS